MCLFLPDFNYHAAVNLRTARGTPGVFRIDSLSLQIIGLKLRQRSTYGMTVVHRFDPGKNVAGTIVFYDYFASQTFNQRPGVSRWYGSNPVDPV